MHFSFIHCHLNYANIAWVTTCKSKLEGLYRHVKHLICTINCNNRFTHAQPLLHDMKALTIFPNEFIHIIYLCSNLKKKIAPPIFQDRFTPRPKNKYNTWSKKRTQFKVDYRGPPLWNQLVHDNFSQLESLPLLHKTSKNFYWCFMIDNNTSNFSNFNKALPPSVSFFIFKNY